MALTDHAMLVQLQARILGQEMFMRAVLTAAFMNVSEPLAALEEMRSDLMRAANEGSRPEGKYADAVWEATLKTVDSEMNQVARRLANQLTRPADPVSPNGTAQQQMASSELNQDVQFDPEGVS